ncbi:MAG: aminomethyl-transferring glycine dehydrogenase subunit GcvPA [Thermoplasmata archaeon]
MGDEEVAHPYIPNSVPSVKKEMLKTIGVERIEDLYKHIPEEIRFKGKMSMPEPITSELELRNHVLGILNKNGDPGEYRSFLGGGCWNHYVPAICDEINRRSEFLTAYAGDPYEDHGRFQALFEYESMMGELLDMDVVSVPTFSWGQAAAMSLRMASRITGRREVIVPDLMSKERLMVIRNYCDPSLIIRTVRHDRETGMIDLDDLKKNVSGDTAAVYFENPAYLGFIETGGNEISDIAHKKGGMVVVGVDPISLGVLSPPSHYGADIVCGELQSLGIHQHFGGGLGGFISSPDDERIVMEYPLRLFGTAKNSKGEQVFGDVAYERTSFAKREAGKDFVGTMAALWGITAGVYLALMGPKGMNELGNLIMKRSHFAMKKIGEISKVNIPFSKSPHFTEFIVDFKETGKNVKQINNYLLQNKIFGGLDLSNDFPDLGNSALFSINEAHTLQDINFLVQKIKEAIL